MNDYMSSDSETVLQNVLTLINNPATPDIPAQPSMLTVKQAAVWCAEAAQRPDPESLWLSLWHEGEVCCLFSDSNLGKSIYAVQIAERISRSRKVIYFDFELSDKQFQLRYTDDCNGSRYGFPPGFLRAEINTEALVSGDIDIEECVINDIERAARENDCSTLIIDNLSFLCNQSDKSDMAGRLMLRLIDLKKRLGLSILVLAHTPKRSLQSPITQNDLAGSKKLFNFFDSVFAIGKSATDESLRYIKQLKTRSGGIVYGGDNVLVAEIKKEGSWLHFSVKGTSPERDHLKATKVNGYDEYLETVLELHQKGNSVRAIADKLGIHRSKVFRMIKREPTAVSSHLGNETV